VRLLVAHFERHHETLDLDFLRVQRGNTGGKLRLVAVFHFHQFDLRQQLPGHDVFPVRQGLRDHANCGHERDCKESPFHGPHYPPSARTGATSVL
jgi:hypothetical protein